MKNITNIRPSAGQSRLPERKPSQSPPGRHRRRSFASAAGAALALLFLCLGLGNASAANILPNPGFEDGIGNWSGAIRGVTATVVTDAVTAHSGTNYASTTGAQPSVGEGDYSAFPLPITIPISSANFYKLSAWVQIPVGGNSGTISLRYRWSQSSTRTDVGAKTIAADGTWVKLESDWLQPTAIDTTVGYFEVYRTAGTTATLYVDDCGLEEADPLELQGRVVDGVGAGVDGATVGASSTAFTSASTTTAGGGYYTLSVPPGTYTVKASSPGYKGSVSVAVSASPTTAPNIVLGVDPDYDPDLILSVRSSAASATAPWPCAFPASSSMARMGNPGVTTIGGQQWETNPNLDGGTGVGYLFGTYSASVPVTGVSIVAVAKPTWNGNGGTRGEVVDLMYDRVSFGIAQGNGHIQVARNGAWYDSSTTIASGQAVVMSLVIQTDGSYIVYTNGVQAFSVAAGGGGMTELVPNVAGGYANAFNIGRNNPDGWSSFNGAIGDVYVYQTAISDTKRQALEASLGSKFNVFHSINATAGTGGTITPSGIVAVSGGANQTFTVTANGGYAISQILVDGVNNPGAVSSGTYTFNNVTADHTIAASFVAVSSYTITASAGANGSISPSGAVVVSAGANKTFTITPTFGYAVASVVVDSVNKGAISTYTFTNVVANGHTIAATFVSGPVQLPAGVVAYWPFDGSLTDPVGGNTLTTGAGTVAYGPGDFGSASLYVNGSTYVTATTFPTGVPSGAAPYTVAAWVKAETGCPAAGTWIAYGTTSGSQANTFRLNGGNDPNWNSVLNYWWGNDFGASLPSGNFFDGWHCVVGTWDGTTETLYLDGVQRARRTPTPPDIQATGFNIGRALFVGDYWKGWIDDVLILDRAMDQAEATAYNSYGALSIGTPVNIVASVSGSGGTISPSGTVSALIGTTRTFTMTPAFGYYVSNVSVTENGVTSSKGAVSTYAFANVQAAGAITVTFSQPPPQLVTGRVTDGVNGIAGAKVYFNTASPALSNPIHTATTDATGHYSISLEQLTWHVMAFALGYDYSAESTFTVAGSPVTRPNIVLTPNANWDLLFSMTVDSIGGLAPGVSTGNRPPVYPVGGSMNMISTPTVIAVDVDGSHTTNWEQNVYGAGDYDGYRFVPPDQAGIVVGGAYQVPIIANGVSVVAVVQPTYIGVGGEPRGEVVDIFYSELFLAVSHSAATEGNVIVDYRGYHAIDTGFKIPDGQKTVLCLVVQPNGDMALYANTTRVWTYASGVDYTTLQPTGFKTICVGRNDPDGWSTFSGNIGDVYLYKSAISDAKRLALQSSLMTKFGIPLPPTFEWKGPSNGNWSDAANWYNTVPGSADIAILSHSSSAGATIELDVPVTVAGLEFNNLVPNTTIASTLGHALTLAAGGVLVDGGSHSITAALDASATTLKITGPGVLNLSGTVTSAGGGFPASQINAAGVVLSGTGSWTDTSGSYVAVGSGAGTSTLTINGTATLDWSGAASMCIAWGGAGSSGKVVQNGGTVKTPPVGTAWYNNNGPGIMLGRWDGVANNAEYDLNGGTLITPNVYGINEVGNVVAPPTGLVLFRFNGGVLQGTQSDNLGDPSVVLEGTTNLIGNLTHAYVGSGGAKIDTATFNCGINQGLEHDSVLGATPDGGLTKMGLGTLTLYKASTYTGPTKVQAGVLACAVSTALGGGALDISTGALLQLDYTGTRTIAQLTFNGGAPQAVGTYGGTGSGATHIDPTHFAGTGTVTVVPPTPPTPELPLAGFTRPGGKPTFQIPNTASGFQYTMVYKNALTDPTWTALTGTGTAPGNGGTITLSDPSSPLPAVRFYRVKAQ